MHVMMTCDVIFRYNRSAGHACVLHGGQGYLHGGGIISMCHIYFKKFFRHACDDDVSCEVDELFQMCMSS